MKLELLELVNQLGQTATLTPVKTGSTYDTTTGKITGGTSTPETVKVYQSEYLHSEIDGTNVIHGDKKLFVSAINTSNGETASPVVGTQFTLKGSNVATANYKVVSYQTIYNGDTVAAYICQVRG